MIIHSRRVYTSEGEKDVFLRIEGRKIVEIMNEYDGDDVIDYSDHRIIPGIFDTHNHGTMGYGFMGVEKEKFAENLKGYLKGLAAQGVTSIFPTVPVEAIKTVADGMKEEQDGATIVGIHSEGPWLNRVGEKGVKTGWPEVSLETAKRMVEDGQGHLRLVAIAPEIPGIDPIIDYFLSQGITIAFAHSDDTYEEARKHLEGRFTVATHLGNVMSGLHHRDIGGLGACLQNENMTYEIICDGMHISNPMLKLYFMIHDYHRFMMISDCSQMAGAPVGRYKSMMVGAVMNVTEQGFVLTDTGRLMGSSKPVLYGIGNLVENLHIPLETVIRMSSLNPCIKYGLADHKGSIAVYKDADLAVISDDYQAIATYAEGRKVYDRETEGDVFNKEFVKAYKLDQC
ncbi:MAG: amidohydrolase family protein [Erysipelotrichaceae bacterium]|nr:amidohydrolase family protein [Erysipelotrichaceae bacterium]